MATLKVPKAICPGGTLNNIHPKYTTIPVLFGNTSEYRDKIASIFADAYPSTAGDYELASSPTSYFGTIWANTSGGSNA